MQSSYPRSADQCVPFRSRSKLGFRCVGIWGERKTWVPREKPLEIRGRTNKKINAHTTVTLSPTANASVYFSTRWNGLFLFSRSSFRADRLRLLTRRKSQENACYADKGFHSHWKQWKAVLQKKPLHKFHVWKFLCWVSNLHDLPIQSTSTTSRAINRTWLPAPSLVGFDFDKEGQISIDKSKLYESSSH